MQLDAIQEGEDYAVLVDDRIVRASVDSMWPETGSVTILYEDRPMIHTTEISAERVIEPWLDFLHSEALTIDRDRTHALLEAASGWVGDAVDTGRPTVSVADSLLARIAALEARVAELQAEGATA